jgi:hypothetical protein
MQASAEEADACETSVLPADAQASRADSARDQERMGLMREPWDWAHDNRDRLANGGRRLAVLATRSPGTGPRGPMEPGSKTQAFLTGRRACRGARRHAPSAGEEFACGNLRPGMGACGGFPARRGDPARRSALHTIATARIQREPMTLDREFVAPNVSPVAFIASPDASPVSVNGNRRLIPAS